MKKIINWNVFFILLGASLISILCVLPYVLTLQSAVLRQIGQPMWLIFVAQFIQSLILFSLAIYFGLYFTKQIHFQLPLLESIVEKRNYKKIFKSIFMSSVLFGIAAATTIYGVDAVFTALGVGVTTHQHAAPIWQTLLASFYGGITEEILLRLFLMTLFIWIGMKLTKRKEPTALGLSISIFLAAIIFGLGHLPITASLTAITPLVVLRAVVLNGIGGIVFGWLFWKKGLESAMLAHFTADIFLLTLLPLVIK